MKTEAQKVWDALKKIYGKNLEAATINVLPGDLKEKANEN